MIMKTRQGSESGYGPFEIYLMGVGVMSVRDSTREGEDCVKASKEVFYIDHDFGIREFLEELCPKVTQLVSQYREGESRLVAYQNMAVTIIDAALRNPPV